MGITLQDSLHGLLLTFLRYSYQVIEILDRIKDKKEKDNAPNGGDQQSAPDMLYHDDDEWDYDGPDEDIIYVK